MSIDLPRCPGAFIAVAVLQVLLSTGCSETAGPLLELGVLTQASGRPLVAPGSPAAQAISSSEIDVTWVDTNSQEQGYSVERSLSPSSGFAVVASPPRNAQAYADLGLAASTTYYYRIRATGRDAPSPYSATVSATTFAVDLPPSVSITSPPSGSSYDTAQTVTIAAGASDDLGVTRVEFYDGATLKGTDTTAPYTHGWSITGADNGSHAWTARAYDTGGQSTTSAAVTLTVQIAGGCPAGQTEYYGQCLSTLKLLAQGSYREATRDTVTAASLFHAPGVVVDRSVRPNPIYVADSGNSRILGFRALGNCAAQPILLCTNDTDCATGDTCDIDPQRPADLIIGQPDARSGSCNGDVNLGLYSSPTASTLCLMDYPRGTNVSEQWQHFNFTTDAQGNLWFPDIYNDRILRYNAPFGGNTAGGEGDGVADFVLGQPDMASNGVNNGRGPGLPSAQSVRLSDFLTSNRGAPSVDPQGNVWIADTGNHRVLRFAPGATTANLVLGQASFTAADATDCSPLGPTGLAMTRLCNPTIAKVNPDTGELYVFDETATVAFAGRLQVFTPPFTSGMAANRTIAPRLNGTVYTGPIYSTAGNVWKPSYEFQITGFELNPYRAGEYSTGVLWFNEHDAHRTVLISGAGDVLKVIGARDFTFRGGDQQYGGVCGSIYEPAYTKAWWTGGALGFDNANNIYLSDENLNANHVSRFELPYNLTSISGTTCLPDPDVAFLRPDGPGPAKISESAGLITFGDQLIVQDQMRLMVWNGYMSKAIGAPVDAVVGQASATERIPNSFQVGSRSPFAIDEFNRLWTVNAHGGLMVFQLPLTSASQPIVNYIPPGSGTGGGRVYWADDQTQITGAISGIAIDTVAHKLWLAAGHRLLRVSNYQDPAQPLYVDMVLGQVDRNNLCNRGLSAPTAQTLCNATRIKLDRAGNLYVVENTYECHPNDRVTVFTAASLASATGMFPNLAASIVFNRRMTQDFNMPAQCGVATIDANHPFSPINVAFNSRNELVIGNDGYYPYPEQRAVKQLYLYRTPLTKQTPDFVIGLPVGATGDITFDQDDNLVVQDHTWYRVWVIDIEEQDQGGSYRWLQATP